MSRWTELVLDGDALEIRVLGLRKLFALRARVRVPIGAVTDVRRAPDALAGLWKGVRFPGTHLPGVLVAGTYHSGGEKSFWNVGRGGNAVAIDLDGAEYARLVIDVEDPDRVVERIRGWLPGPGQPAPADA